MNLFMRSLNNFLGLSLLIAGMGVFAHAGNPEIPSTELPSNDTIANFTVCEDYKKCLKEGPARSNVKSCGEKPASCSQKPKEGSGGSGQNNPSKDSNADNPQSQSNSGAGGDCSNGSADPRNVQSSNKNKGALKETVTLKMIKAGEGNQQACQGINEDFAKRAQFAHQSGQAVGLQGTNYESLQQDLDAYGENRASCLDEHANAGNQCLEGLSPNTSDAAAGVNNVLGQIGQNTSDTCSKASKAMEIARAGLTAFSGQCGAAKGACSSSCKKASEGIKTLVSKAQSAMQSANCDSVRNDPTKSISCQSYLDQYRQALSDGIQMAQQEIDSSNDVSLSGKQKMCDQQFSANIGSALQGAMSMLAGMLQGGKCQEETAGTDPKGSVTDKCILPENANLPECICKANPRAFGCSTAYQAMSGSAAGQLGGGLNDKVNIDPSKDGANLDSGIGGIEQASRAPGSSDSPGAPMGGGSAGLGNAGGGSGAANKPEGGAGPSGLNANILGGAGGGGGGAGTGLSGLGSNEPYRQYLPGGAKDPAKAFAGQQAWTKEVTGQGGKSNWEKVKDRYRDNSNTLLNNQ